MIHYHGDNEVFTTDAFTNLRKEEGQFQGFGGVGVQHQNIEAERAIQTVVYMLRTFMIYCAFH